MSNFIKKYPAISQFVLASILGGGMVAPIVAGVVPSDSMFLLIAAYSASLAGVILTAIVTRNATRLTRVQVHASSLGKLNG